MTPEVKELIRKLINKEYVKTSVKIRSYTQCKKMTEEDLEYVQKQIAKRQMLFKAECELNEL